MNGVYIHYNADIIITLSCIHIVHRHLLIFLPLCSTARGMYLNWRYLDLEALGVYTKDLLK